MHNRRQQQPKGKVSIESNLSHLRGFEVHIRQWLVIRLQLTNDNPLSQKTYVALHILFFSIKTVYLHLPLSQEMAVIPHGDHTGIVQSCVEVESKQDNELAPIHHQALEERTAVD